MNFEILKMQISGNKSLTSFDEGSRFVIAMQGDVKQKPVVEIDKNTNAIAVHVENFTGSGLDFGMLMMAVSNAFTQGDIAMKGVKALDTKDPNVIATLKRNGDMVPVDKKTVSSDDLQLKTVVWLMREFEKDDFDPLVGIVGLARTAEKNGMVSSTKKSQAEA